MDDDRKYRQHGYMDSDRDRSPSQKNGDRPRPPQGPRSMQDPNGPRLPRLVQAVTAARCFSCSTTLPQGIDFKGNCPKCGAELHCCKQCSHFEPSTRFQCSKPIKERIAVKDKANQCELFSPRVTVMRDAAPSQTVAPGGVASTLKDVKTPDDARAAFDNLFKK